ncbi:MAG: TetR/AcrR family transcriptional regulator [Chrysiogenetes bacterium]|nr:TetR/AcrR family transcriptional regulator [Chrysiogenetes bacterium]
MPRYASKARQEAEEARHRRDILNAAMQVFVEKGFHTATMRDVAQSAEFSVGKLYLHFSSKEALYQEMLDQHLAELLDRVEAALGGADGARQRIENAVREQLSYFEENPLLLKLFVNETLGFEMRLQAQFGRGVLAKYHRYQTGLVETFESGLASGEFVGATGEELALKLSGILNALLTMEVQRPEPRPVDVLVETTLRLFCGSPLPDH